MTNRLFPQPRPNARHCYIDRPIEFTRQQRLNSAVHFDQRLLELIQVHAVATTHGSIPQTAAASVAPAFDAKTAPLLFDDFGLVEGIEIDARWM